MTKWVAFDALNPPFAAKIKVDVWAKKWDPDTDLFLVCRFPDVHYDERRIITEQNPNPEIKWSGITPGWRPTHYMNIPDPPFV